MNSRAKSDHPSYAANQLTIFRPGFKKFDERVLFFMMMLGTMLALVGRNFAPLELDIFNIPSLTMFFGTGVSGFAMLASGYNIIKILNAKKNLPPPMNNHELVNIIVKQPELVRRKVAILKTAKFKQGAGNKKQDKVKSRHFLLELISRFSLSHLKEIVVSKLAKPKQILGETVLTSKVSDPSTLVDKELNDDRDKKPTSKKLKKHKNKLIIKSKEFKKDDMKAPCASDSSSFTTANMFTLFDVPSQPSSLPSRLLVNVSQSSTTQSVDEVKTPLVSSPRIESASSPDQESVTVVEVPCNSAATANVDASCLNSATTATTSVQQQLSDKQEMENKLEMKETEVALLKNEISQLKREQNEQAVMLKQATELLKPISPEIEDNNSSTFTLKINMLKPTIKELSCVKTTMSDLKETRTNPASYDPNAYTQREYLSDKFLKVAVELDKLNQTSSVSTRSCRR